MVNGDIHLLNLGDILIFMPGQEDIEVTCELISGNHDCQYL